MLTLQFIRHTEIEPLSPQDRINKIMSIVKQEKIVLLEGRLRKQEEADLIKLTMEEISDRFKGIEIATIEPGTTEAGVWSKLRVGFADILLGDRSGLTIVGPASIIKSIRKDPNKIQLLVEEASRKKKR